MPKTTKTALITTIITFILALIPTHFTFKAHAQDITAPTTSLVQTPSSPDGENGWYRTPIQFDLTATDLESGVATINYRIDGGTWQTTNYSGTLNLLPNPSFEILDATSTAGVQGWEATNIDGNAIHGQTATDYAPGYSFHSAKMEANGAGAWHGINNYDNFAVATPYQNMTASVWLKTVNTVLADAHFRVYAVSPDGLGGEIIQEITRSASITTDTAWTKYDLNFTVNVADAYGVYLDIGLEGEGELFVDAVSLAASNTSPTVSFTVGSDGEEKTVEYYATDHAGNIELYNCAGPTNCVQFDLDTTPPGNWRDSGAFRGFFGAAYQLWTYVTVDDVTSGLQVFSDRFQYRTELNPTFGRFSNISSCSSTWLPNEWVILITPPFTTGANSAFLLAPKTSYCNTNWRICKTVRFYVKDVAGNESTKEFCINGPWIRFRGEAIVRANEDIDMLSEADGHNTDGLIEIAGNNIDFFSSENDWEATNSPIPEQNNFTELWDAATQTKEEITDGNLRSATATYNIDGNLTIDASAIPSDYNTNIFNQVVFINGDLTIDTDVQIDPESTALFIVSGDVNISKNVLELEIAILSDGTFSTAYDITEGEDNQTLELRGIYSAEDFNFQRTLQGTDNNFTPSEDFTYEPKYVIEMKDFFGGEYSTRWVSVE